MLHIVVGASRGFGRCLALEIARRAEPNSELLLLSRSVDDLVETAAMAQSETPPRRGLATHVHAADLSDTAALPVAVERAFTSVDPARSLRGARLYLVSGTLGPLVPAAELHDLNTVQRYFATNVSSMVWLTGRFLTYFSNRAGREVGTRVVNISSLAAVKPVHSWSLYCAGKAARDMATAVVGLEGWAKTLNYAPGPMETEMLREVRRSGTGGDSVAVGADVAVVDPAKSAALLLDVLESNAFASGAHLDYFDLIRE